MPRQPGVATDLDGPTVATVASLADGVGRFPNPAVPLPRRATLLLALAVLLLAVGMTSAPVVHAIAG